jgi:putative ABC transport system ATP-binding protein
MEGGIMPMTQANHSNNRTLIELHSVFKSYETGAGQVPVLKDINLQVGEGEFIGLVGPSGSGKSTLINMITGIDRPTSGDVWVAGQQLNDMSENKLARFRGEHIGVIFQFFQLLPTLTVIENVMLPMDFCHVWKRRERRERAMELLELVEVPEIADKLPSQTSGGQQQRAAIARALANDPKLVVGDEPTGNLDTVSAGLIFALFEELVAQGKTLIMVTHDRELARLVPRIEELRDGRLVAADEIDQRLAAGR